MLQVPFSPPDISEEEVAEVASALRSGWITTGPKTKQLEALVAQYCGNTSKKAVCLIGPGICKDLPEQAEGNP